jgi:hypothetical protein
VPDDPSELGELREWPGRVPAARGTACKSCSGVSKSRLPERHCPDAAIRRVASPKEQAMKYLLMIYAGEAIENAMSPEDTGKMMQAYGAYTEALVKAGVMQAGERLRPTSDATSVRVRGGKTEVLNGPYAETREQLGGYYLIDVADLDAALAWAARCPGSSHGTVEVRPIWAM